MTTATASLELLCINTLRTLAIDAVQKANSGHPGLPLGAAPMAYVLWQRAPAARSAAAALAGSRPLRPVGRARQHAALLRCCTCYGYDADARRPEAPSGSGGAGRPDIPRSALTPGVEATTGPLGQGSANAVGMAIAERLLAHRFNRPGHTIVDHRTFALVSDGDLMEGVSAEAASLAGHLGLGKLIYLYDANDVTLDGPTSMAFTARTWRRAIDALRLARARRSRTATPISTRSTRAIAAARGRHERPSLIVVHTTIGYGSPNKAGTSRGARLAARRRGGRRDQEGARLGPGRAFYVPSEAEQPLARVPARRGARAAAAPRVGPAVRGVREGEPRRAAKEWRTLMPASCPPAGTPTCRRSSAGEPMATRAGGAARCSTRLAREGAGAPRRRRRSLGSTKTTIEDGGSFDGTNRRRPQPPLRRARARDGRDRQRHRVPRRAAPVRGHVLLLLATTCARRCGSPRSTACRSIFVWTHDSIGLGEDGPTHQPVEHLMALRAMPNLHVVRPATPTRRSRPGAARWSARDGPTALVLSRQNLPVLDRAGAPARRLERGAYVLADADGRRARGDPDRAPAPRSRSRWAPRRGSRKGGSRRASCRCRAGRRSRRRTAAYRESVLPPAVSARVSVEAGVDVRLANAGSASAARRSASTASAPRRRPRRSTRATA